MKTHALTVLALVAASLSARANDPVEVVVHDRARGELSPGTSAPTRERMLNAIKSASPTALYAMLEYGERVECFECIPQLEKKLLQSDNAQTREIAAWWLRRRSFGFGAVMVHMRDVIEADADPTRRARAAQALGEFLDPHALPSLVRAATLDAEVSVRAAAVRALGRLNAAGGHQALIAALSDDDARVRQAAIEQIPRVAFLRDEAAVLARLSDDDARVRRTAAHLLAQWRVAEAVPLLIDVLQGDGDATVRQAAAIALGRLGGAAALDAIAAARRREQDDGVSDALEIAARMRRPGS